jgi:hypothetical protein
LQLNFARSEKVFLQNIFPLPKSAYINYSAYSSLRKFGQKAQAAEEVLS